MKYLITENKLNDFIYEYLDTYLKPNEISMSLGENPNTNEEDENFLIFYKGDWEGEDYSDMVFHYFTPNYYENDSGWTDRAPILEVLGKYAQDLDNMFGKHWNEPMKKWFQNNFNLPVKTLSTYY